MITTVEQLSNEMDLGAQTFEISGELYSEVKTVRSISRWKYLLMVNSAISILVAAGCVPIAAPALILVAAALGAAFAGIIGFKAGKTATKVAVGLGSMDKMTLLRSLKKVSDSNNVLILSR